MIYVHVIASVFNRMVQMGSSFIGWIGIFAAVESNGLWNYFANLFYFGICVTVMKHALCALQNILWYWYFNFIIATGFLLNFFESQHKLSQHKLRFRFQYIQDYILTNKTTAFVIL